MGSTVETDARHHPTREPAFTEVVQIGIIVRDLDATLQRYAADFGIGPWTVYDVSPENAPDLLHDGQPLRGATRSAYAMIGNMMWEVFQPLDEHGIFARYLAEKGEGVHHIALRTPDFAGLVTEQLQRGRTLPLSGSFTGVDVAYLPTDRDLGVMIEIFSGMPGDDQKSAEAGDE